MKRIPVVILAAILLLPSPEAASRDWGRVTGSLESNSIRYFDDSFLGTAPLTWGSNNYLKMDWTRGAWSAGFQAEYYPEALAGYPSELKGAGVPALYASWTGTHLGLTAGTFYEQWGSGLVFRSWEDRDLGLNNAVTGGLATLRCKGLTVKAFTGAPRYGLWPTRKTVAAGGDLSLDLLSLFGRESAHSLRLEGSVLDRLARETEAGIRTLSSVHHFDIPAHVVTWSGRLQYAWSGFSIGGEFVGKTPDYYMEALPGGKLGFRNKGGNAQLVEANFAKGGLSASLTLRRLENMTSRIFLTTDSPSPANTLNYLPSLCMQQTYMLAGLNPYVTCADGEAGFQGDIYYRFPRGSALGGKYGMKLHVGGSWIDALPCALPDRDVPYLAYRDINIDLERAWSRNFRTILFVSIQENSPTHGNRKATDAQNVFVLDALYRLTKTASLRMEVQYLYSQELTKDWMAGLVELSFAPHWSVSVSDMYNHGDTRVHYYNLGVSYAYESFSVSLLAGRNREGMVCSGGVCRWQPAYKGVGLRLQWSF